MNLQMNAEAASGYTSDSQKVRMMTGSWAAENLYCPFCGCQKISCCEDSRMNADFYCPDCGERYELKSKNGALGDHIAVGAYDTMLQRINAGSIPNYFFIHYSRTDLKVKNIVMVPKYFIMPEVIEKREPLSDKAKQARWSGCNISFNQIPADGKILIVKDGEAQPMDKVISQVEKTEFIGQYNLSERSWVLDVLRCVDKMGERDFAAEDVYQFEEAFSQKHSDDQHAKDRIERLLQILNENGMIEFCGDGCYRRILDA
ncbi:MAG: restriction endonuclease [Lachnospiraceae bacterium]|nr:restriction endonuclease [Lachnospiraceae bacterium]